LHSEFEGRETKRDLDAERAQEVVSRVAQLEANRGGRREHGTLLLVSALGTLGTPQRSIGLLAGAGLALEVLIGTLGVGGARLGPFLGLGIGFCSLLFPDATRCHLSSGPETSASGTLLLHTLFLGEIEIGPTAAQWLFFINYCLSSA